MIELDGKYYQLVEADYETGEDLCFQCDYMQNKGFIVGTCPDTPCNPEYPTVLKEVDYAYI